MIKRKADRWLAEWIRRRDRKPLIIKGARQVGKTCLVQNWAAQHFKSVVTVDLERERELHGLFELSDPKQNVEELSLLKRQAITAGETLLFLDEIQACPAALGALRYFYELMPQLHVIAAGSLLDFALREFTHSMPVGRIEYLHLQPLTFEEFVEASEGPALVERLGRARVGEPVSEALEQKLIESLRRYFFVGGMPEAVRVYLDRQDLLEVQRVQTGLVSTVQDDFAKYGPRQLQELMRRTYRHVAANVGRKVKFVNISREDRSADVRRALELLSQSRMVSLVYRTAANGLPLGAERDERHFKALFLDVGLMNRLCGLDLLGAEELVTINEGALAEQYVGQELRAARLPFEDPDLFYWSRDAKNASAEVDYVIARHQEILPVEVKAGKTGRLRSVFQFLQEKNRRRAVRFHLRPPAIEEVPLPGRESAAIQLLSLPLYLTGQLDRLLGETFDG